MMDSGHPDRSRSRSGMALLVAFVLLAAVACGGDTSGSDVAQEDPTTTRADSDVTTTTKAEETTTTGALGPLAESTIDFGSLGPIRVGMDLAEVEEAGELQLHISEVGFPSCADWFPAGRTDLEFRALDDELATILASASFSTTQGPGVGSSRADVIDAYGESNVEERSNRFGITELLVSSEDPQQADLGILFSLEAGGETVAFVMTGTLRGLNLDEGCV